MQLDVELPHGLATFIVTALTTGTCFGFQHFLGWLPGWQCSLPPPCKLGTNLARMTERTDAFSIYQICRNVNSFAMLATVQPNSFNVQLRYLRRQSATGGHLPQAGSYLRCGKLPSERVCIVNAVCGGEHSPGPHQRASAAGGKVANS